MAQNASVKRQLAAKAAWNEARSPALARFFTLGYSGRKLDEIIQVLLKSGVKTLVDIRRDPVSRFRPEMNKRSLEGTLADHSIVYAHASRLGVPREVRSDEARRESIWDWYDANVLATFTDLPEFLEKFAPAAALMCTELDPHECHRHRLALHLEALGFPTFDL